VATIDELATPLYTFHPRSLARIIVPMSQPPRDQAPPAVAELAESHRNAVLGLATVAHLPVELVADHYRRELTELEAHARITQYLPVIATRRVRERLRSQRTD
jgi:Protein of unknown function (DUF3562)